jgi:hypothetical protein
MADSGMILITFSPFPTQNALSPPPLRYSRMTARFKLLKPEKALSTTGLTSEVVEGVESVMRKTLSRSKGAVAVRETVLDGVGMNQKRDGKGGNREHSEIEE